MEDDKLKELFQGFRPDVADDKLFLQRLQKNMDAVEMVRRQVAALRRRSRIAVVLAALCGFAMGVILTLLFPLIRDTVSSFNISISGYGIFDIHVNWQIIGWIVMAGVCALTSLNAYEITISRLTARKAYA